MEESERPTGAEEEAERPASEDDDGPEVHTPLDEPHPSGTGARSDRDIGGPVAEEDAPPEEGAGKGTRESGFEPHE